MFIFVMSIETNLLITDTARQQMKVINDELYEMMWELQPAKSTLAKLKELLCSLAEKAWEDYLENTGQTTESNELKINEYETTP